MKGLSILIPTYNDKCLEFVRALSSQCEAVAHSDGSGIGGGYEILVGDDGSTDQDVIESNKRICSLPNCAYIIRGMNTGRAAIRNFLVSCSKYDTLLFIDGDMSIVRQDFISKYISENDGKSIIYGGYCVPKQEGLSGNLRYKYERHCRDMHTAEKRQLKPYRDFHTSNFMVPRDTMVRFPLDEKYRHYGYEDVAYGQTLRHAGISIRHIDNPTGFCTFEDNEAFINKTEEGIRTLVEFKEELKQYSRLLTFAEKTKKLNIEGLIRIVLHPFRQAMKRNLYKKNFSLEILNIYKISYLLDALHDKEKV